MGSLKKDLKDVVLWAIDADADKARELADKLNIEIVSEMLSNQMVLRMDAEGLSLLKDGLTIRGDFSSMKKRLKLANLQHEMLVKAAKIKGLGDNPTAIDATAGLGEDSILLAAAGYHVKMYERDEIIAALLEDALQRAKLDEELKPIVERMELIHGDSIEDMENCVDSPDLIYLDPMFPARSKSGLIKKKFQLLQQLESPCEEGERMVMAARAAKPKKIIIKRPAKGEYLAGIKPNHSLEGKAIRYDCLIG